jgi:hypothetical protein
MLVGASGHKAEAASVQPISPQHQPLEACSGYYLNGSWVTIQTGCQPDNGCWNWGCGNNCWNWGCGNGNACWNWGCNNGCVNAGCACYYYGCADPTRFVPIVRVVPIYTAAYNLCSYGCAANCGYNNYGAYGANYYGFNNYCQAPVVTVKFENPPASLACGTSNSLIASAFDAYGRPYYGNISFSTSRGTVTASAPATNGRATVTLNLAAGSPGIAQVTALAGGQSASTIIQVVC